jgi:hypothetical protein
MLDTYLQCSNGQRSRIAGRISQDFGITREKLSTLHAEDIELPLETDHAIWIVDSHRGDRKRFVVRADEKLTAFLELEAAICACGELP